MGGAFGALFGVVALVRATPSIGGASSPLHCLGPCEGVRCELIAPLLPREGARTEAVSVEAAKSGRALLEPGFLRTATTHVLAGGNASTGRYVGAVSNLAGEDPSAPRGIYFTARLGAVVTVLDGVRYGRGLLFRQAAFLLPSVTERNAAELGVIVDDYSDSHNLNVLLAHGGVVAVGGGRAPENEEARVYAYRAASLGAVLAGRWLRRKGFFLPENKECGEGGDHRRPAFDGGSAGCVEKRTNAFHQLKKGSNNIKKAYCFFDGKHSLVYFREKYFVFARANLQHRGGRFLQVTRASTLEGPWSRFSLLDFLDFDARANAGKSYLGNVYFGAVNVNPLDARTLLGLFPLAQHRQGRDQGYIALSLSCDGVHWAKMTKLVAVPRVVDGRPVDMPVDGFAIEPRQHNTHPGGGNNGTTRNTLFLFVQRHVPGVVTDQRKYPTHLVRYEIDPKALARYTAFSKRKLGAHCASS
mmetsp:Transcript_4004/g.13080  ORF Transcript_4004/g.13080 Transcript_4004/m.13080 type:complete len:471 (-) Transcript_4004:192-1604(-)